MKKIVLIFMMFCASHALFAHVNVFQLDEKILDEEFAELSHLESLVLGDVSFDFVKAQNMNCIPDDFSSASANGFQGSAFSFQWEGFLWGFLCCPIGVFVVALNKNKTKDNKTSFWIGVAGRVVLNALLVVSSGGYAMTTTTY